MKILIIGGVAAGPKTACRLKRLRPEMDITILDQDNLISYGGCGIPYFISGDVSDEKELRSTSFHTTRDVSFFAEAKGIAVRTRMRALDIDRQAKIVTAENLDSGAKEKFAYDRLVLATGSSPQRLALPGADLAGVYAISDLHQAITIKNELAQGRIGRAAIIGGGFIGIEMAEAFGDLWGVDTSIIEYMPQIMPRVFDPVFANMIAHHLREKGVAVYTGESALRLEGDSNGRVCRVITPNRTIAADVVIMAVGVRPRSSLARETGLLVGSRGGIVVNNRMQTSDPDIYAAGDCVEITNLLTGKKDHAPMGSLANRQGRVVADNLAGIVSTFNGWIGSFVLKVFDIAAAATGLTLEGARQEGFDAAAVITAQSDRAHFFPQQAVIPLQMVFDRKSRRVLGVQGFGPMGDGILARIDAAAAMIAKGATVEDYSTLELAYSPPFATAIDALNAIANVADNLLAGRLRTVPTEDFLLWMEDMDRRPGWVALDIRHPAEAMLFVERYGARWLSIPYVNVRDRYPELPRDRRLVIICDAGTRSFEVQCFLDSVGMNDTAVLGGGFNIMRRLGLAWWPRNKPA